MGKGTGDCNRVSLISVISTDINWNLVDLGKRRDSDIAAELGVRPITVLRARHKRNIPAYKPPFIGDQIDWDTIGLGDRSDAQISKETGVSRGYVEQQRKARGIPSSKEQRANELQSIDWDNIGLGTESDPSLAQRLGCSFATVAKEREKRDIPSYVIHQQQNNSYLEHDSDWWDDKPLGEEPDTDIAKQLSAPLNRVRAARIHRGIEPFSGGVRTQEGYACDSLLEARYDAYLHWQCIGHQHQVVIPGTKYIADFQTDDGTYIEVTGMQGFAPYDAKLKVKQATCESLGIEVQWVSAAEAEALCKDCPLELNLSAGKYCHNCQEPASHREWCKACFTQTYFEPELYDKCVYTQACAFCNRTFGWNRKANRSCCSQDCSNKKKSMVKDS